MVQDEDLIRVKIDELDRWGKLPLVDQDVVDEAELPELSNPLVEGLPQDEPVVRFILNDVPDTL
jgi:hypothetical protein